MRRGSSLPQANSASVLLATLPPSLPQEHAGSLRPEIAKDYRTEIVTDEDR